MSPTNHHDTASTTTRLSQTAIFTGFSKKIDTTIVELIFDYVVDASLPRDVWALMSSRKPVPKPIPDFLYHLSQLRLVNSAWNDFIVPLLYRSIHLSSPNQPVSLLSTLQCVPARRPLVHSLTITIPSLHNIKDHEQYPLRRTFRKLFQKQIPSLTRLIIVNWSFYDTMTFLKDCLRGGISLKLLVIQCYGSTLTITTGYLWSILREFKGLEEFWFEFNPDDDKTGRRRDIPKGLRCERVRRVGIQGVEIGEEDVERLGEICPCLEEMEINGETRFYTI